MCGVGWGGGGPPWKTLKKGLPGDWLVCDGLNSAKVPVCVNQYILHCHFGTSPRGNWGSFSSRTASCDRVALPGHAAYRMIPNVGGTVAREAFSFLLQAVGSETSRHYPEGIMSFKENVSGVQGAV